MTSGCATLDSRGCHLTGSRLPAQTAFRDPERPRLKQLDDDLLGLKSLLRHLRKANLSERDIRDPCKSINPDAPEVPLQWLLKVLDISNLMLARDQSPHESVRSAEAGLSDADVQTDTLKWQKALGSLPDEFSRAEAKRALEKVLQRKLPEITLIGRLRRFGCVEVDGRWYRPTASN